MWQFLLLIEQVNRQNVFFSPLILTHNPRDDSSLSYAWEQQKYDKHISQIWNSSQSMYMLGRHELLVAKKQAEANIQSERNSDMVCERERESKVQIVRGNSSKKLMSKAKKTAKGIRKSTQNRVVKSLFFGISSYESSRRAQTREMEKKFCLTRSNFLGTLFSLSLSLVRPPLPSSPNGFSLCSERVRATVKRFIKGRLWKSPARRQRRKATTLTTSKAKASYLLKWIMLRLSRSCWLLIKFSEHNASKKKQNRKYFYSTQETLISCSAYIYQTFIISPLRCWEKRKTQKNRLRASARRLPSPSACHKYVVKDWIYQNLFISIAQFP